MIVNNLHNPYSTSLGNQKWQNILTLNVFLSHSKDCEEICDLVSNYLTKEVNNALRKYSLSVTPIMYENWPPTLKNGNATQSSLAEVEDSSILFAFIYRRHGNIRNDEIEKAISLYKEEKIQDVCIFFKKTNWPLPREDKEIISLKKKISSELTYKEFSTDVEVIKVVSQIIMKSLCEIQTLNGAIVPAEELHSGNGVKL